MENEVTFVGQGSTYKHWIYLFIFFYFVQWQTIAQLIDKWLYMAN